MDKPEFRVERGPAATDEAFAIGMAKLLEREGRTIAAAELRRLHAENETLQNTKHYEAPPRRTMVPLTDEEIDAEWHELDGEASALFKRVIRKFARAVEKASWEKNK